jgi:hypothetical protein
MALCAFRLMCTSIGSESTSLLRASCFSEGRDLLGDGILPALGTILEGRGAVLEQLLLPAVEERPMDAILVT